MNAVDAMSGELVDETLNDGDAGEEESVSSEGKIVQVDGVRKTEAVLLIVV